MRAYCSGAVMDREGVHVSLNWPTASTTLYSSFVVGHEHACGLRSGPLAIAGRLDCFGADGPFLPFALLDGSMRAERLAIGGRKEWAREALERR